MKKRKKFGFALVVIFTVLSLMSCVPKDVKNTAKENKKKHENEFIQRVETDLGPDYTLSNVSGHIRRYVSDYSFFADYSNTSQLEGEIEHNGQKYAAMYDYDKGILYSDVFTEDIINSLAEVLGMDTSKIIYGCIINHNGGEFPSLFPVNNRNFGDMLSSYQGGYVEFYIVTSEDIYGLVFDDYENLCETKQSELYVNLFSSDNFQNLDHFKKNYYGIIDCDGQHPQVWFDNESRDVFTVYNLKGLICIDGGDKDEIGDIRVRKILP